MKKILLVRVSSLGDVVQTFPAVTDIVRHLPGMQLDWVVEEAYVPLARMHPGVARVLPFALRRWRSQFWRASAWRELGALRDALREHDYDLILDAQGLIKSAAIAKLARGPIHGFGSRTVREPFVARAYDATHEFPLDQHRLWHYRGLAAQALGYSLDERIDYGVVAPPLPAWASGARYCVLLHSTARPEKLWRESDWIALGRHLEQAGVRCVLPWGSDAERARAERLAAVLQQALVAPRLSIEEAGGLLGHAEAVIGLDTGLMHLAVALEVPVVGIYCGSEPGFTGPLGAGPTAFRGGMGWSPTVDQVLEALREVAPALPG